MKSLNFRRTSLWNQLPALHTGISGGSTLVALDSERMIWLSILKALQLT